MSEEVPLDPTSALSRGLFRLERAGFRLRGLSPERVDAALSRAAATLLDPETPLGKQVRATLPARTELSSAMVEWALEATLSTVTTDALALCRDAHARSLGGARFVPSRLHAVVLSSNLFTVAVKPIVWSLLLGSPVAVKVSVRDEGFAELFALAVLLADEEVGAAVFCTRFGRDDDALTRRLIAPAETVSIYGSDATIHAVRAHAAADADVVPHGHGLGAVLVGREALDGDVASLVDRLALDVAAYDQRGCLSPQLVLVEEGGAVAPRELARLLSEEGLARLARTLPRGPLAVEDSSRQVQWRRVSQAIAELFEGDGYAVAFDDRGPLRPCPRARNIAVHAVSDANEAVERLLPLGAHLKCLGTTKELCLPMAPRVCALGLMQRPTLLEPHDGRAPWQGLGRRAGV